MAPGGLSKFDNTGKVGKKMHFAVPFLRAHSALKRELSLRADIHPPYVAISKTTLCPRCSGGLGHRTPSDGINVSNPSHSNQDPRTDLNWIVGEQQIIIHTKIQTFLDLPDLAHGATHQHVNVGKLIISPNPPDEFQAVKIIAKTPVGDDITGRANLEVLPEVARRGET